MKKFVEIPIYPRINDVIDRGVQFSARLTEKIANERDWASQAQQLTANAILNGEGVFAEIRGQYMSTVCEADAVAAEGTLALIGTGIKTARYIANFAELQRDGRAAARREQSIRECEEHLRRDILDEIRLRALLEEATDQGHLIPIVVGDQRKLVPTEHSPRAVKQIVARQQQIERRRDALGTYREKASSLLTNSVDTAARKGLPDWAIGAGVLSGWVQAGGEKNDVNLGSETVDAPEFLVSLATLVALSAT